MEKKVEEPLIKINWRKLKRYIGNVLRGIIELGKGILIVIIKILTLLVKMLLAIYKRLSKFAKSKQKGGWILLLLFLFLLNLVFSLQRAIKHNNSLKGILKRVEEDHQNYEELLYDYEELYNQVKEIEAKPKTQSYVPSTGVEPHRYLVERYFPPEQVENALAIMDCESGGNQGAVNYNDAKITGYPSYGLFQINGPDNWEWDEPDKNIDRAVTKFYMSGWNPWRNCAKRLGLI